MDGSGFDALVRAVSTSASRRQALRFLAASAFAGLLPRRVRAVPAAQGDACDPGLTFCEEQPGWAPAGCYDLSSDYLHCGDCMYQCPSAGPVAMACIGGACVVTDCGDLTDCTGNLDCTNLGSDANNCGACGNVCASGVCQAGICAGEDQTCAAGLAFCPAKSDPVSLEAGCYDLASDYTHCGSCDNSCPIASPGPMACIAGVCQPYCAPPLTLCENPQSIHPLYCADVSSDPGDCGACGNACESGVCQAGVCM